MNTVTRAIAEQSFNERMSFIRVNAAHVWLFLLCAALFLSAFGIVYVKDMNRRLYITEQAIEHQNAIATERWSKLLLERSALTTQPRVEKIASKRFGMVLPGNKNIVLVNGERKPGMGE